jgi:hypothetical protein
VTKCLLISGSARNSALLQGRVVCKLDLRTENLNIFVCSEGCRRVALDESSAQCMFITKDMLKSYKMDVPE